MIFILIIAQCQDDYRHIHTFNKNIRKLHRKKTKKNRTDVS